MVERDGLVSPLWDLLLPWMGSRRSAFIVHQEFGRFVWTPAHRTQRLTLETLDLGGIRASSALQVEVLTDRIVE